jgi:hypothetical protein
MGGKIEMDAAGSHPRDRGRAASLNLVSGRLRSKHWKDALGQAESHDRVQGCVFDLGSAEIRPSPVAYLFGLIEFDSKVSLDGVGEAHGSLAQRQARHLHAAMRSSEPHPCMLKVSDLERSVLGDDVETVQQSEHAGAGPKEIDHRYAGAAAVDLDKF